MTQTRVATPPPKKKPTHRQHHRHRRHPSRPQSQRRPHRRRRGRRCPQTQCRRRRPTRRRTRRRPRTQRGHRVAPGPDPSPPAPPTSPAAAEAPCVASMPCPAWGAAPRCRRRSLPPLGAARQAEVARRCLQQLGRRGRGGVSVKGGGKSTRFSRIVDAGFEKGVALNIKIRCPSSRVRTIKGRRNEFVTWSDRLVGR